MPVPSESTSPRNSPPTISIILIPLVFATILILTWISRRRPILQTIGSTIQARLPSSQSKKSTLPSTTVNEIPLVEYSVVEPKPSLALRVAKRLRLHIRKLEAAQAPDQTSQTCPICAEDFADGVQVRKLPCEHVYHPACVDEWLVNFAATCPMWYVTVSLLSSGSAEHS